MYSIIAALLLALTLGQSTAIGGSGRTAVSGSGRTALSGRWLMLFGDSRTANTLTLYWPFLLTNQGYTSQSRLWVNANAGQGGATVASTLAVFTATLAAMPAASGATDIRATINLGANDMTTGLPAAGTWNANYLSLISAIHAKWPTAQIYLMRPWVRNFNTDADTIAGRIDTIVATNPTYTFLGPDERVWLKGSDDGATMTTDGEHYSAAGNAECVVQWTTKLWP